LQLKNLIWKYEVYVPTLKDMLQLIKIKTRDMYTVIYQRVHKIHDHIIDYCEPTIFPGQKVTLFAQYLDTSKFKEPRINLPEKFDGTCSKFQGFVN